MIIIYPVTIGNEFPGNKTLQKAGWKRVKTFLSHGYSYLNVAFQNNNFGREYFPTLFPCRHLGNVIFNSVCLLCKT